VRADRARPLDEAGFTLVEATVALMVLGVIFTALAAASLGSIRASLNSRAEQQAIDFATQALERARQMDYYALGHDATDVASDSTHVISCDSSWCFDSGEGAEPLVLIPGGTINPHVETISADINNGTNFTVATYVTRPPGEVADVKRVTVVSRWTMGTKERERVSSSLVTATTRGLPIPLFAFETAVNTQAVNPRLPTATTDPVVAFKVELTNQGAPDRWDLSADSGTWTFWRDNGDNLLCRAAAECGEGVLPDTLMADSDDPGTVVDTGRLDPTTNVVFWAVRDVPETTLGEYWSTLTATAVSLTHGGVEAAAGTKTLALRTIVTDEVVTGQPGGGNPTATAPSAPLDLTLTVSSGQLTAAWVAPQDEGSSAVSDYVFEYRSLGAATWTTESDTSTALEQVLAGLTNGITYEARVAARNDAGVGPWSNTVQGTPEGVTPYVAPAFCATPNPASVPVPTHENGFTLWNYALHNRSVANPAWPGEGAPPPTWTSTQGVPLNMIKDYPALGVGTALPVYSADVALDPGRVILPGGGVLSPNADTTRFVDWRTDTPGRMYQGTAVLTLWIAPATGSVPGYSLSAQLYRSKATDTAMDNNNLKGMSDAGNSPSNPVTVAAADWCGTVWQQVSFALPIDMSKSLSANEYLGVRLWNSGAGPVRIAYDVKGDFPAYLTLPEK
jgi:type II secretory pathway pseudopilin PulG